MPCTATHCATFSRTHTATHLPQCLQDLLQCCVLQCVAVCCSVLQCPYHSACRTSSDSVVTFTCTQISMCSHGEFVCIYVHTYIHICTHTCTRTHTHTRSAHTRARTHTHRQTDRPTDRQTDKRHIRTCTHKDKRICTCTCMNETLTQERPSGVPDANNTSTQKTDKNLRSAARN